MSVKDVEANQQKLIGDFPNTYTFTKHLGEKLITKYWGDVPLVIIRPSIIGNSVKDPCWGWIDSNSAATAIYFAAATGVMQALPGNINTIGDQIPVDYTACCIIAASAHYAAKNWVKIIHSSSSSINPCTWAMVRKYLYEFGNKIKITIALWKPKFKFYSNEKIYNYINFIKWTLPYHSFKAITNITGNEKMKETLKILELIDKKINTLFPAFWFFW